MRMSGAQQYFLGVGGEQTGPFGEADLVQKIQAGEIPQDALVWYEGLPEWAPIRSIPAFKSAYSGEKSPAAGALPPPSTGTFKPLATITTTKVNASPSPATTSPKHVPSANAAAGDDPISTFAADKNQAEPVFDSEEAVFSQNPFIKYRALTMAVGLGGIAVVVAGGFYLFATLTKSDPVPVTKIKATQTNSRDQDLRQALSELLINPQNSLATLNRLIQENPSDEFAKQAIDAELDYYKSRSPQDAGRLLVRIKRAEEAIPFFLQDPPSFPEAEQATFAAFEQSSDPVKKKELLKSDIKILLSQLNNTAQAVERIKVYEKTFPGEAHPYTYYLKTADEKIKDIFDRISFYFVQTLLGYIRSELPQINLVESPLVEMKKDKAGRYRVAASYSGDVILNNDRLTKIKFTFWLATDRWHIVETNLTVERKTSSEGERERLKATTLSGDEMIRNLEQIFKTQYPKTPLHEKISKAKPALNF